jgi:hypothetical protein
MSAGRFTVSPPQRNPAGPGAGHLATGCSATGRRPRCSKPTRPRAPTPLRLPCRPGGSQGSEPIPARSARPRKAIRAPPFPRPGTGCGARRGRGRARPDRGRGAGLRHSRSVWVPTGCSKSIPGRRHLDRDDMGSNRSHGSSAIRFNRQEHDVVRKPAPTFRHHAL